MKKKRLFALLLALVFFIGQLGSLTAFADTVDPGTPPGAVPGTAIGMPGGMPPTGPVMPVVVGYDGQWMDNIGSQSGADPLHAITGDLTITFSQRTLLDSKFLSVLPVQPTISIYDNYEFSGTGASTYYINNPRTTIYVKAVSVTGTYYYCLTVRLVRDNVTIKKIMGQSVVPTSGLGDTSPYIAEVNVPASHVPVFTTADVVTVPSAPVKWYTDGTFSTEVTEGYITFKAGSNPVYLLDSAGTHYAVDLYNPNTSTITAAAIGQSFASDLSDAAVLTSEVNDNVITKGNALFSFRFSQPVFRDIYRNQFEAADVSNSNLTAFNITRNGERFAGANTFNLSIDDGGAVCRIQTNDVAAPLLLDGVYEITVDLGKCYFETNVSGSTQLIHGNGIKRYAFKIDSTKPILNSAGFSKIFSESATLHISSKEPIGQVFYLVRPATAEAPTVAEVKGTAGQLNNFFKEEKEQNIVITQGAYSPALFLEAEKSYVCYFIVSNQGNETTLQSIPFTTPKAVSSEGMKLLRVAGAPVTETSYKEYGTGEEALYSWALVSPDCAGFDPASITVSPGATVTLYKYPELTSVMPAGTMVPLEYGLSRFYAKVSNGTGSVTYRLDLMRKPDPNQEVTGPDPYSVASILGVNGKYTKELSETLGKMVFTSMPKDLPLSASYVYTVVVPHSVTSIKPDDVILKDPTAKFILTRTSMMLSSAPTGKRILGMTNEITNASPLTLNDGMNELYIATGKTAGWTRIVINRMDENGKTLTIEESLKLKSYIASVAGKTDGAYAYEDYLNGVGRFRIVETLRVSVPYSKEKLSKDDIVLKSGNESAEMYVYAVSVNQRFLLGESETLKEKALLVGENLFSVSISNPTSPTLGEKLQIIVTRQASNGGGTGGGTGGSDKDKDKPSTGGTTGGATGGTTGGSTGGATGGTTGGTTGATTGGTNTQPGGGTAGTPTGPKTPDTAPKPQATGKLDELIKKMDDKKQQEEAVKGALEVLDKLVKDATGVQDGAGALDSANGMKDAIARATEIAKKVENPAAETEIKAKVSDMLKASGKTLDQVTNIVQRTRTAVELINETRKFMEEAQATQDEGLKSQLQVVAKQTLEAVSTIEMKPVVKGNVATVRLTPEQTKAMAESALNAVKAANEMNAALAGAGGNLTPKVTLDLGTLKTGGTIAAEMPGSTLKEMVKAGVGSLELTSGSTKITIDSKTVPGNAATFRVEVKPVTSAQAGISPAVKKLAGRGLVVDVNSSITTANGKVQKLTKLNSPIELEIPYKLKKGENPKKIEVNVLNDKGGVNKVKGVFDEATQTVKVKISNI